MPPASERHDVPLHGFCGTATYGNTDSVCQHVFGRAYSSRRTSFVPLFYGAAICALVKKGGGIRPIALGSTLRRLVAKAACRSLKDAVVSRLLRHSSGLGLRMVLKLLYMELEVFW
jgi:hypothetical protein